ncbi:MAG: hypothetical protein ABI430_05090 [Candidatus Taylorbacteria bacterium]
MKKIFITATLSFFSVIGIAQAKTDKVSVCHVTSSETNPMVLISVSSNAVGAHLGHGDFLLPTGQTECVDTPPNPE